MLELIVLVLFIGLAYLATVGRNLYLNWRDKKQERILANWMVAAQGERIEALIKKIGDPYEIEAGTTGRTLYIWKFPPSQSLPPGRGLLTLIATADHDIIVDIGWKRKR